MKTRAQTSAMMNVRKFSSNVYVILQPEDFQVSMLFGTLAVLPLATRGITRMSSAHGV